MKLARLLTDYLIEHKELTLTGFGHFSLVPSQKALPDDKKDAPIGDIIFRPDPKARIDDNLIQFISGKSGKMRPLAVSDLESYLEIGRQLLNISKPFAIEGIGTLLSRSDRSIEFVQGEAIVQGEDSIPPRKKKVAEGQDMDFEENYFRPNRESSNSGQRLAIAALVILGLCLIGWVAWFFYQQSLEDPKNPVTDQVLQEDQMPAQPASYQVVEEPRSITSDSMNLQPLADSSQSSTSPRETDTAQKIVSPSVFEVVLEVANKKRALQRYADLREWGHKVQMSTQDSLTFKLSIPIDAPLSDSIRHRDSLSRFFGRKVWIETH